MTPEQQLWIAQAKSDYETYELLRNGGASPCQQLHYLQMTTEKLVKALVWEPKNVRKPSHAGFGQFMRLLAGKQNGKDRKQLAQAFGFQRFGQFQAWANTSIPLANEIEKLAPAIAGFSNPNAEYPWPQMSPAYAPVQFNFPVWGELNKAQGRQFVTRIGRAITNFSSYV
jgi:hypothetical protein